ncbi:hypothetical protein [Argonema galeatum]|uniref:hypothetical protein n=1 Tax=Argonema galeatum TaxID=2942762 RepID=UPI0020138437|nr:hypothetical protein [Argonema galeatum]MCL1466469.1 hypothetical protein [Argonema galeatum A003/A1]
MSQELIDLRTSILEGRYVDALAIVDDLEGMSKQSILANIQSFLDRMMMHLIKNQVDQRLTNYRAASIADSIIRIKRLNTKENKTSYYLKADEWDEIIEESLKAAIIAASVEVFNGELSPNQLSELVERTKVINNTKTLLGLIYVHSARELPDMIPNYLAQLPGGEDWKEGRR